MATEKHFLCMCYPAFGHITPMLELARKISVFHKVTFVVSEAKIDEMLKRQLIPSTQEGKLQVLGLRDGLNDNFDQEVGPKQFGTIIEQTEQALREILENMPSSCSSNHTNYLPSLEQKITIPVDVVIADSVVCVPAEICHRRGIPFHILSCMAAAGIVNKFHIDENTPTAPDDAFFTPEKDENGAVVFRIPVSFHQHIVSIKRVWPLGHSFLVNSVAELEPESIQKYQQSQQLLNVPLKFIGPIISTIEHGDPEKVTTAELVKKWLDSQPFQSVVYFSFGSMAVAASEQTKEIAKGLLALNKPFIWSLRTSQHQGLPEEMRQAISKQFDAPLAKFLVLPWAPQKIILAHSATRVFVSHCGWNSMLESLTYGIPVVAWPLFADQHANAEMLTKLGVSVGIAGTSLKCLKIIQAEELQNAVITVGGWEAGASRNCFEKAQEWKRAVAQALAPSGSSHIAFLQLITLA